LKSMIREGGFSPRAFIGASFPTSARAQRRHVVEDESSAVLNSRHERTADKTSHGGSSNADNP
jgi:hypothetical protein